MKQTNAWYASLPPIVGSLPRRRRPIPRVIVSMPSFCTCERPACIMCSRLIGATVIK